MTGKVRQLWDFAFLATVTYASFALWFFGGVGNSFINTFGHACVVSSGKEDHARDLQTRLNRSLLHRGTALLKLHPNNLVSIHQKGSHPRPNEKVKRSIDPFVNLLASSGLKLCAVNSVLSHLFQCLSQPFWYRKPKMHYIFQKNQSLN